MEAYFFIPASKIDKIQSIFSYQIMEFIIDFEDSIKLSERDQLVSKLIELPVAAHYYLRVPLHESSNPERLDLTFISKLIERGFKRFVFPKIISIKQLDEVLNIFEEEVLDIVLLIENPRLYIELLNTINSYHNRISAIGLGSHDFMASIGGKHTLQNLEVVRQHILYMAKAANIISIDIASMDLKDAEQFRSEVVDGFDKGYNAKFVIHPRQLQIMQDIKFYNREEYVRAVKIMEKLSLEKNKMEFAPIVVEGKIIERPHIENARKIIANYKKKHI
ncbi:MAG: hypothetical protein CMB82_08395 [Flammeovirgaceae bacterium]|nr:hypothetical protein [Flammeovirgaceae bacterium]